MERQLKKTASPRQLWVTAVTAGLSPAAALAGSGRWHWLLLWCAALAGASLPLHVRLGARPLRRWVHALYALWGTAMAGQVLDRAARRLELTSGGAGQRLWMALLVGAVLLCLAAGGGERMLRTGQLLWLAMAAVSAAVILLGILRLDWSQAVPRGDGLWDSALTAGEVLSPVVFIVPYINGIDAEDRRLRRQLPWAGALAAMAAAFTLVTRGLLGGAAQLVEAPFFVAAGLLGRSARLEGLLSALWLMSDLVWMGLLCLPWGRGHRPLWGAAGALALALTGVTAAVPRFIWPAMTFFLLLAAALPPGREGK